jgi:hypothetical protein
MREKGLTEVRFRFDFEGTKILNQCADASQDLPTSLSGR